VRLLAVAVLVLSASGASAQDVYPARPVQVIVPFSAGGNSDVMARPFFEAMGRALNGAFTIVNREGGGGTIGFTQLAAARPDGYTLGFGPTSPATNAPHMMKKLTYGVDDFDYICQVFENIFTVAVAPDSPIASLPDLVERALKEPGKLTFGSAGVASLPHLTGEGFAQMTGIKLTHVPFRGDGQVIPAVLGGQIDFSMTGMGSATESLRVLAIFADKRNAALPDVPTAAELGLPTLPPGFQGVYAPKGTPPDIVAKLEKACATAANSDGYLAFARRINQTVHYLDGASFTRRARDDYDYKGKLIRSLHLGEP
jgi:tripartite-type tricarboxylate transporter receptor subunit TctC